MGDLSASDLKAAILVFERPATATPAPYRETWCCAHKPNLFRCIQRGALFRVKIGRHKGRLDPVSFPANRLAL